MAGYRALAITDHGDQSNIDLIIPRIAAFCEEINRQGGIRVIPGIELTHISPESIPTLVVIRDRVMIASQPGLLPRDVLEDLIQKVNRLDMDQVRRELDMQGQT